MGRSGGLAQVKVGRDVAIDWVRRAMRGAGEEARCAIW